MRNSRAVYRLGRDNQRITNRPIAVKMPADPMYGVREEIAGTMLKVLIVEDTATFRLIVRRQLNALGINSVTTAVDGEEALALLQHEPDFDVILCDWHMAPMDGFAICASVQKVPYLRGRNIPVIFMTGDTKLADPEKRRRALGPAHSLGISDILIKPFTVNDLRNVLARCAGYIPY